MTTAAHTRLLTIVGAADKLGVSVKTIRRRINDGKIPALRIDDQKGSGIRIDERELDAWLYGWSEPGPVNDAFGTQILCRGLAERD